MNLKLSIVLGCLCAVQVLNATESGLGTTDSSAVPLLPPSAVDGTSSSPDFGAAQATRVSDIDGAAVVTAVLDAVPYSLVDKISDVAGCVANRRGYQKYPGHLFIKDDKHFLSISRHTHAIFLYVCGYHRGPLDFISSRYGQGSHTFTVNGILFSMDQTEYELLHNFEIFAKSIIWC